MLNKQIIDGRSNEVMLRSLIDNPDIYSECLGCSTCPERKLCGGLAVKAHIFDCLDLCCGQPEACTRMCANAPSRFVDQIQEIDGFDLGNLPRFSKSDFSILENIIPLIYHGGRRNTPLIAPMVAIRLSDIVDYRGAKLKFKDGVELRKKFRLGSETKIIITGVDHDAEVEAWWTLGEHRISLIREMHNLQISAVTVPNFSLVVDNPRTDDLHSIKRIGIVYAEFRQNGICSAIHPNGLTFADFQRWRQFIKERSEIDIISYEFITGSGKLGRLEPHLKYLIDLAIDANRNLTLILRGNPKIIPRLRPYFASIVYIDTTAFMKTMKRQAATRIGNRNIQWQRVSTGRGEGLDDLMAHNLEEHKTHIIAKYFVTGGG